MTCCNSYLSTLASRACDTAALQVACRPARHGGPGTGVQLASVWVEVVGTDRVDSSWVAAGYAADVPVAARQVGAVTMLDMCRHDAMADRPMPCDANLETQSYAYRQRPCVLNMSKMLTAGAAPVPPSVP